MEYDVPSINRQVVVPMQRVADDNVLICDALNYPGLNWAS